MASWDPITQPIDYFILTNKKSPGIGEIVGANSPRKWDEQQSFGWSGATLRFAGLGLSKFDAKVRLYTVADWAAWNDDFEPLMIKPPAGRKPKALNIWHPFLVSKQIFSVVVADVIGPVQIDDGVWEHTIQFVQHRERRFQLAKPDAAKAEPKDPIDALIDQRAAVAQNLLDQLGQP